MEEKGMEVWITKYALTKGILHSTTKGVIHLHDGEGNDIQSKMIYCLNLNSYFHKPYWHESLGEAIKQADSMRNNAIKSAQKRIDRLKELKFE